jgi:Tol biopolymer transport system component
MRADLERLKRDVSLVGGREEESSAPRAAAASITGHQTAAIATIGFMMVLASLAWLYLRRPPASSPELIQKRLTFNSSENPVLSAALSPDSKYLAYSDRAGIHVKLLSSGEERLIPKPAAVPANAAWLVASWFPDGTQILANAWEGDETGSVWSVSMLGQSPHKLRDQAFGFGVSPDGTRVSFTPSRISARLNGGFFGMVPITREIWIAENQGDNPQRVVALAENESALAVSWAPDGQHLAYIKDQYTREREQFSVEARDVKGANRTVVLSSPELDLAGLCWLADGRIVYSRQGSGGYNLWQIAMDSRTGSPAGEPKRITQWPGSYVWGLQANADGKRLAVVTTTFQTQVYLGELAAGGTRMNPPRRLTNDEAFHAPYAWTPDSHTVLLNSEVNGKAAISKQGIDEDAAQLLIAGPQDLFGAHVTPDGAWMLYLEMEAGTGRKERLMRIPIAGGAPQLVLDMRIGDWFMCARAPADLCVINEASQDGKQMLITAFDPLKGRTKVLRTLPNESMEHITVGLSPDGRTFAIARSSQPEIHIRLLSLSGGADREITVKSWPNTTGLDWAPDGKGIYFGSVSPQGSGALLYVDLAGNVSKLWQHTIGGRELWAIPSPDGRYLAINAATNNSNAWMLEGF